MCNLDTHYSPSMASLAWRLHDLDGPSGQERELYQRAHEAAREAQRQGDAQLQAALAAASSILYPVSSPVQSSWWSLSFLDRRLETVYWRKCGSQVHGSGLLPLGFQLLVCAMRVWSEAPLLRDKASRMLLVGHTTLACCCVTMMVLHLAFSNWYRLLLCYFVVVIWCWECLVVYHSSSNSWVHAIMQSVFLSYVYRVPFCLHMRVRIFGLFCQAVGTIARDASRSAALTSQLVFILLGHLMGTALAYFLDSRTRCSFLKSLPRWLLSSDAAEPSSSPKQQLWSKLYPEFLEKSPRDLSLSSNARGHRALGGFAGGFGGVSGLKCPASATTAAAAGTATVLSTSSDRLERLPHSLLSAVSSSASASSELRAAGSEQQEQESVVSSACSLVRGPPAKLHEEARHPQ